MALNSEDEHHTLAQNMDAVKQRTQQA